MQHPYAVQKRREELWQRSRVRGLEFQGVNNSWGDKEVVGIMADNDNQNAINVINRYKWLDTLRQDDAKYKFFIEAARKGTPFRNRHRQYRIFG
ncbi:MAG: hypothetical protein JSR46_03005 [Verrucomicrobia bacterium]|nr:hypothetical protein [Verrucomicrobiota bacterium]